jgi:hypothetical protein
MVRHNTDGERVGRKFALGQVGALGRSDLGKFDTSSAEFPFYPQAHPVEGGDKKRVAGERHRPENPISLNRMDSMKLRQRIKAVQTYLRQRGEVLRFDEIHDPRKARGQRWSLGALLSTAVFSLMAMARSLRGAERFSEDLASAQKKLGIDRRVPDSTLGDFLAALDPQELRHHLHRQVLAEHRRKALEPCVVPIRAISIDGKTVATLSQEANTDCQKQNPQGQVTVLALSGGAGDADFLDGGTVHRPGGDTGRDQRHGGIREFLRQAGKDVPKGEPLRIGQHRRWFHIRGQRPAGG